MKKIFQTLLVLLSLNIASCSHYKSSPRIWIFNLSDNYVRNVQGNWNGQSLIGHMNTLEPGLSGSENLILKHQSDFFGPVHIEWENASGKKIVKEFIFKKDQLPPTKNHNFDNVFIFLTQEDFELFSEGPGPQSKEVAARWKIANGFREEFLKVCPKKYGCDLSKKTKN